MRSPFREKYNFDSMLMVITSIALENNTIMLIYFISVLNSNFSLVFMCRALICVEEIRVHYHVNDRSRF